MRISKQRLRQILREELEIALLKEQFFDPNSSPGGTLFDQWRNVFSNARSAFTNAYNQSYNQATGATNPATNTGTTATNPPAEAPNLEATITSSELTIRYYFKPETTREEIARANITNMLQPVYSSLADQIDISIVVNNLRATFANSGYPADYDWTQYANQLKESFRSSIRVSAPNIQENDAQTIASYTIATNNIPALNSPNISFPRSAEGLNGLTTLFAPVIQQINRALPNKLLPPAQAPNRRNPDF